jgi:hypothetical protein
VTRWRTTEFPTVLPTTKPTRVRSPLPATPSRATSSAVIACTTSLGRPTRRPFLVTSRKLSLPVSRADAGSTQVRRTDACDPCRDEQRGWPDRHGCACAAGTHGYAPGGGCSAEKYACSRWISRYWLAKFHCLHRRTARRVHPHLSGDLMRVRTPDRAVQSGWRNRQINSPFNDTPRAVESLPTTTSCGIARRLLACGLLVGQRGVGALLRRAGWTIQRWGCCCGPSCLRAQLWTTLWMPPVQNRRAALRSYSKGLVMNEASEGRGAHRCPSSR